MRFTAPLMPLLIAVCALVGAASLGAGEPAKTKGPVSPEESLALFELEPGLEIELVACEPDVIDPVAIQFDEDGRLWVAEYRDYPLGPPEGEAPLSRIRILEDTDGDGRYETSHLFAEKLPFCNGIQPWKGGVFVTSYGSLLYLKDTDGDQRADQQETWFTGFSTQNSQLFVNHPRFGLDNHIYTASGKRGGEARSALDDDAPVVSLAGHDLRFDPHTGKHQSVAGCGQFGLTFDDHGNRYICSNRNPLVHVVLEERYLGRNKHLAVPTVEYDVGAAGEASRVFPLIEAWTTSVLHAGQYTAACGVDIYRGDALPEEYRGNGFTCEPTGSLVHREIIESAGGSFTAHTSRQGAEFLASRDPWCKPVYVSNGPDGALYVVDMYRFVIEHPQFMPEELKQRPDLRYGDDRGRIYRIVRTGSPPKRVRPQLSKASSAELVELLGHPNGWWRETAARLIYERQDKQAIDALAELVSSGESYLARMHALWALHGLEGLTPAIIEQRLGDEHPRVREQAVILAEPLLAESSELAAKVRELASNDDAKLRFQVALTLGVRPASENIEALHTVARRGLADSWTRWAVLTAVGDQPAALLGMLLSKSPAGSTASEEGYRAMVTQLAQLVGARQEPGEVAALFESLGVLSDDAAGELARLTLLTAVAEGLQGQRVTWQAFAARDDVKKLGLPDQANAIFQRASKIVADHQADDTLRQAAARALAFADYALAGEALLPLVASDPSQSMRLLAIAALSRHTDDRLAPLLLESFNSQTPAVRGAILDALLARVDRIVLLLDAIESGAIKASSIDTVRANRLLKHRDKAIVERATQVLAAAIPADRVKVLAEYQAALELQADPLHGRQVFQKNCSTCHRIGDLGTDVGPSIADLRTKTPLQVLTDVLQPNRAIDNNFISYSIITGDGLTLTGIIINENPSSVTIRLPEGKNVSVLKSNIELMMSNGVSLMPEGLERTIPLQDMADVIAFVKNWRYLDGEVPVQRGK